MRDNLVYKHMEVIRDVAAQVVAGTRRSAIISGPPGIGKNYVFEDAFRRAGRTWNPERPQSEAGLIEAIQQHNGKADINLFDECDYMLRNQRMLGVLKIATDTKATKKILSYRTRNKKLCIDPFEVQSSFVFLLNTNLHDPMSIKDKSLGVHIQALNSRCNPFVMSFSHDEIFDYTAYLVVCERMLMRDFSREITEEALAYFAETMHRVRDVSPRRVRIIASEIKRNPARWRDYMEPTLGKPWRDPPSWTPKLEPRHSLARANTVDRGGSAGAYTGNYSRPVFGLSPCPSQAL